MKLVKTIVVFAAVLVCSTSYAKDWAQLDCGPNFGPVKQVAPAYPKRARQRGVEGHIIMNFNITTEGKVEGISVVEGKQAFARAATRALSETEFKPCVENGAVTALNNVSIKYDFNLK